MHKIRKTDLFISIAIAELVGLLSGFFAGNSSAVYQSLNQPPLSPPGWVFPVVWTALYACMGTAAYFIYRQGEEKAAPFVQVRRALILYAVQLAVNFLWSIVFFGMRQYGWAIAVIVILDLLVIATLLCFAHISQAAAWLMLPYLVWILFATYLNVGVYLLN